MRDIFLKVALRASQVTPSNWIFAKVATLNEDLSMPLTESMTLCQYCEHVNQADARFCVGCGAQMHLVPCPACGAVNDKSAKTCYQCHGQLRASTEILLQRVPVVAEDVVGDAASALPDPSPRSRQRQPLLVVIIIFAAFTSAAYFAYRQRGDASQKGAATDVGKISVPAKSPEPTPPNFSVGAINKAAATTAPANAIPVPIPVPMPAPVTAAANAPADQAAPLLEPADSKSDPPRDATTKPGEQAIAISQPRTGSRATQATPANPPAVSVSPGSRIDKKPPPITACTEGIAALGLCAPAPTKGK